MIITLQRFLTESPLLALVIVFWAGAIASLSSCTIVRVPIVLGYVAGTGGSKKRSMLLSVLFVLGLIVSYTLFGILLGLIGNLAYSFIRVNKYIFWAIGTLLFICGLFISGLVDLNILKRKRHIIDKFQNASFLGAFLFGVVFALLEMPTCPCCGGVLLLIAGIVVAKNLSLYSIIVFISFALGQSFPILSIGLSTSMIKSDLINYLGPKVHRLEQQIKLVAGNILMVLGIYFCVIA
jgi:cytochrome c biogenesis protein CcdA